MLIDNSLILDIAVALTTSGSSTNYIDTIGAAGGMPQISGVNTIQGGYDAYESLWWEVLVDVTVTGTGGNIDFQLWTSANAASIWTTGNAGSLPTVTATTIKLGGTGVVPVATLTPSYGFSTRMAQGCQRFIAGYYVMSGGAITGGKWSSVLVPDIDINLT